MKKPALRLDFNRKLKLQSILQSAISGVKYSVWETLEVVIMHDGITKQDKGLEFNFMPVTSMEEIKNFIQSTPKPNIKPDKVLELGYCGMGMPVIKSHLMLSEMEPGEVLRADSSHACSFSDIHAFARRSKRVKLVGLDINEERMSFYLQVV